MDVKTGDQLNQKAYWDAGGANAKAEKFSKADGGKAVSNGDQESDSGHNKSDVDANTKAYQDNYLKADMSQNVGAGVGGDGGDHNAAVGGDVDVKATIESANLNDSLNTYEHYHIDIRHVRARLIDISENREPAASAAGSYFAAKSPNNGRKIDSDLWWGPQMLMPPPRLQTMSPPRTPLKAALRACAGSLGLVFAYSCSYNLLLLAPSIYLLQIYDRVLSSRSGDTLLMLTLIVAFTVVVGGVLDALRRAALGRMGEWLEEELHPAAALRVLQSRL